MVGMNVAWKSTLSSSLVYHLPLQLPYSCLTMRSLVFVTKRKMNRTNIWIHAFTNHWMYSIYTERQGRKTADWSPFSWQFVLSADHFTTNQVVYMHALSGIFLTKSAVFQPCPHWNGSDLYVGDKRMTWTNTPSVPYKWIDGRKHVRINGCSI